MRTATVAAAAFVAGAEAKVYFSEKFDADWSKRWTEGKKPWAGGALGEWKVTKGETGVDEGLRTQEDARFYSITAPLDSELRNEGKDLVISYTVKHDQNLQCGGAYIKLVKPGFKPEEFGGSTDYNVMFGPDVCGITRKTHVIFNYNGSNLEDKKTVRGDFDRGVPHRYTLIVRPDNTYEVQIDGAKAESGNLVDDFAFLKPKTIKDPSAKKPADWVDEAEIADPTDKKPEGWDDIPAKIPDPAAKKPEDWDDEEDGEWEAPQIDNPEYKGPWTPKKVPNPEYKGPWIHPEIPNPEYVEDKSVHAVCNPCAAVGFELWQVQAGTIFDDIIVADSVSDAEAFAKATFEAKKDAEKAAFDKAEEAKRAAEEAERKKAEAEAKTADKEDEDDEDDSEL